MGEASLSTAAPKVTVAKAAPVQVVDLEVVEVAADVPAEPSQGEAQEETAMTFTRIVVFIEEMNRFYHDDKALLGKQSLEIMALKREKNHVIRMARRRRRK